MILTAFYLHPPNSGCLSGKDAGSLIYGPGGKISYRAPTGAVYPAPVQVPFGGGVYDVQPPEVSYVQEDGTRVRCDRKWTTEADHYVGTSGTAANDFPGGEMTLANSSIDLFNIPDNDAFNTMQVTDPMYQIPAPVYRPVQGAHHPKPSEDQLRYVIAILVIIAIVYVVARSAKTPR